MTPAPPRVLYSVSGPGFTVREVEYAPGYRQPPHSHDEDGISILIAGAIRETAAGGEEVATCLSVVVKPAAVVHADQVGPRGARTLQVLLDRAFEGLGARGVDLGLWRWIHAGPGTRGLLALYRELRFARADRGQAGRGPVVDDRILEILGDVTEEGAPVPGEAPPWLARAREALDDAPVEGMRVRDLAADAGVHPVSLTRAFRRHYGASVSDYRRRARLRRAAAAIEGTGWGLSRVAHANGYVDHPHMCREVRAATGLTPSELRRISRGRSAPARRGAASSSTV